MGLTLWLFWPATKYGFLNFDDDVYVSGNPMVLLGLKPDGIRWALKSIYESYWLPVMWLSYMLDTTLFGTKPFGYHFVNILLHAINAGLLFAFLRLWTKRVWASFFVAALFAWHPLRVESVAWIAERKDVLSGLFLFLSLFAYGKFARRPATGREVGAALFMALGLLTKPILVTLPLLLLLLDFWPFGRWAPERRPQGESALKTFRNMVTEKVLFWSLMLLFAFLTYYTQSLGHSIHSTGTHPWSQRLLAIPTAYLFYLGKTVHPMNLSVVYSDLSVSTTHAIVALLFLGLLTAAAFRAIRRSHAVLVGWLWFGLLLGPVIGIIRVGTVQVADRFTYLPSIGLAICVTWFAVDILPQRRWTRPILTLVAVALLLGCAWQTRRVLPLWQSSLTLFENATQQSPNSSVANNNYGDALLNAGRLEESVIYFERAAQIAPANKNRYEASAALALILMGRSQEAIARLEPLLKNSRTPDPYVEASYGIALVDAGEVERGIPYLERTHAAGNQRLTWTIELAGAYLIAGQMEKANALFAQMKERGWIPYASVDGICMAYLTEWEGGRSRHAWKFFEAMLARDPDNVFLVNNVAWLIAVNPPPGVEPGKALELALHAKALCGNTLPPNVMDTLAVAYAANDDFTNALHWINKAYDLARANGADVLARNIAKRRQAFEQGKRWTQVIAK